ncbi:MAG: hypothetical protein Q7S21_06350 [archaeon]|nr:hypothetical protein [archaeon]
MSRILIIESDNQFFADQLRIEGITADNETNFDSAVNSEAEAIIFNNVCISEKECREFSKLFEKKANLVFLNPCVHILQFFGIRHGLKEFEGNAWIDKVPVQIFKAKELYADFPFKVVLSNEEKKSIGIGFEKFGSNILLFGFNYNQTIFHLNQGNTVFMDTDGDGVLRIDDGITVDRKLKLIPQTDILRQFVVSLIEERLSFPLPRIWFYPNKKKCGIIFSHDSDTATKDDVEALMEIDSRSYIKATIFAREAEIPSIDFEKAKAKGMDVQQHTVYAYAPNVISFLKPITSFISSTFLFKFFQKKLLHKQKQALERFSQIKGNRNHGLIWNKLTDHPFWLHEEGFEFDSTYGANYDNGYLQGTGLPYFLRDPKTLKKSNVLEFPSQIMEAAFIRGEFKQKQNKMSKEYFPLNNNFGKNYLNEKFMKEFQSSFNEYVDFCNAFIDFSAEKFHSLVTINFHYSQVFPEHLQEGFILAWYKDLILHAKNQDSLIESMSFFNDFWRKKLKAKIGEIEWDEKNKILNYEIKNNEVNLLSQIIPMTFNQLKLKKIETEGKTIEFEKMNWHKIDYALFNVPNKKEIKISVIYS